MIELARAYNIIEPKLEYDTTWERGQELYMEFETSTHNDGNLGEYECIENFLENDVPSLNDRAKAQNLFEKLPACDLTNKLLYEKLNEKFGGKE
tara:strand:+ start:133 stop:414 length:282 start_codon:yes stop_codon:yes gene_type:complete